MGLFLYSFNVSTEELILSFKYWFLSFGRTIILSSRRVPTRTGKPGKMGRHFPVREKSGNFDQTGKVREKSRKITQNTGKLREFQTNIICYSSVTAKLIYILLAKFDNVFSLKKNH